MFIDPDDLSEAAAGRARGQYHQHRLGEEEPGGGEELFRRVSQGRARLLPGLSWRLDAQGDHRPSGQERDRTAAGDAQRLSVAIARSRTAGSMWRASLDMQGWYRKNKFISADFPAERLVDTVLRRLCGRASSGRSCWKTRTASCRVAGDRHMAMRSSRRSGLLRLKSGQAWLSGAAPRSRSITLRKEFGSRGGARRRDRRHQPARSRRANSSASSGRPAAASRPCCASWPASISDRRHHQGRCRRLAGRQRDGVPGQRSVSLDERREECRASA